MRHQTSFPIPRFALIVALALALGLGGCGGCEDKPAPPATASATFGQPRRAMIRPPSLRLFLQDGAFGHVDAAAH